MDGSITTIPTPPIVVAHLVSADEYGRLRVQSCRDDPRRLTFPGVAVPIGHDWTPEPTLALQLDARHGLHLEHTDLRLVHLRSTRGQVVFYYTPRPGGLSSTTPGRGLTWCDPATAGDLLDATDRAIWRDIARGRVFGDPDSTATTGSAQARRWLHWAANTFAGTRRRLGPLSMTQPQGS